MNLIIFVVLAACWYSICWLKEEIKELRDDSKKAGRVIRSQHNSLKTLVEMYKNLQGRVKSTELDVSELEKWADKVDALHGDDFDDDEDDCSCGEDIGDISVSFCGPPDLYASEMFAGGCKKNVEWEPIPFTPLDIDLTDPGTAAKLKETESDRDPP